VLEEGDELGGERCAVRTAGSETGVQRCIPSGDSNKLVQLLSSSVRRHRAGELRPSSQNLEVGQGSPDQAHQPSGDISVPK
jgi:hypothetical protein